MVKVNGKLKYRALKNEVFRLFFKAQPVLNVLGHPSYYFVHGIEQDYSQSVRNMTQKESHVIILPIDMALYFIEDNNDAKRISDKSFKLVKAELSLSLSSWCLSYFLCRRLFFC
jgi:hypothetical protein